MGDQHRLKIDDAAALLGCSVRTVRQKIRTKGLPCIKPLRELLFSEEEILAWKLKQRPRSAGPESASSTSTEPEKPSGT